MSNLVPTQRVDKNGRTVTRNMKAAAPAEKEPALPAVSLNKPVARSEAEDHALNVSIASQTLWEYLPGYAPGTNLPDRSTEALTGYSDATLHRVINFPWSKHSVKDFIHKISKKWNETTANDYMEVTAAMNSLGIDTLHAASWHRYDLHPANNEGDYPEERLSQLVAIVTVVEHMQYGAFDFDPYWSNPVTDDIESTYLPQDDLREFILHPGPYNRDDIVDVILSHDAFDAERIKAILDFDVQPMKNGIL